VGASGEDHYSKRVWRIRLLAARRALSPVRHAAEAAALAELVVTIPGDPVCCYLPIGTEPGTLDLVTALADQGREVLLPVVVGARPLDWARYAGPESIVPGPFGLREPAGQRLGAAAIGRARLVLVPALAVDRTGVRLGRGGGHYDRSLPLVEPGVPVVAVVRDEEVVPTLPAESHDVRMTAVLTPYGGYQELTR
jgi:5-formyltetrahydrofolate cyclo-ligase